MSEAEVPVPSDAEQIKNLLIQQNERMDRLVDAVNSLGANQQWMVENVQGIFQMFSTPAFMGQIQGMLGGMLGSPDEEDDAIPGEVVTEREESQPNG